MDFFTVFGFHLVHQVIVAEHAQTVVFLNVHAVFVDKHLVKIIRYRLSFQYNCCIAQPGQYLGGLAAGVCLFNAAGQRAFAAN